MRIELFALDLLIGVSIVTVLEALSLRYVAFPLGVVIFILGIAYELLSFLTRSERWEAGISI